MWLTKVSGISEICLICLAMTGVLRADQNLWIDTNRAAHFQEDKSPGTKPKVYTNDDLSKPETRGQAKSNHHRDEQSADVPSSKQRSVPKESRSSSALDSYRDAQGHDRAYWQKKMRPLRNKLDGLDLQIQDLQQKQANTNVTTGLKVSRKGQLHASQKDSAAALAKKIDALKLQRASVLTSIQEVEEDARKAQALPEWLR
jgi:hypothetical protein